MSTKSTTEIVGSDAPRGENINWFHGGTVITQTETADATDASNGYITLTKTAEFGSVIATVNGVATIVDEYDDTTAADNDSDTNRAEFPGGITVGDEIVLIYIDSTTSPLAHVAASMDVSIDSSTDVQKETVHGQANKVKFVGATDTTATIERLVYNLDFIGACMGSKTTDSAGNVKVTTAFDGSVKLAALVGEEKDSTGAVIRKWFLYGCQTTSLNLNCARDNFYKEQFTFEVDKYTLFQAVSS